jgi:mannosidase alpha-like ER degradation enhancer 1
MVKGMTLIKVSIHNSQCKGMTDLSLVGHYPVRLGHIVYINDTSLLLGDTDIQDEKQGPIEVQLRFYTQDADPTVAEAPGIHHALGYSASFGADFQSTRHPRIRFWDRAGLLVNQDRNNPQGCEPYQQAYPDSVLFVRRGGCTFLTKLIHARAASAAGVVVISHDNALLNPTVDNDEMVAAGDLDDVALVYVTQEMGKGVSDMLDAAEKQVMLVVESKPEPVPSNKGKSQEQNKIPTDQNHILYINGLPLLNTRLLV